ncbi:uncharacterized protein LOC117650525 [Thrips palmi]|uniref:Uncharacterized protein LOC117650525 n=1 Tax=Thrips palmi TaxID=161013 RepID=A0A6P8ZWY6_THRPL|nr:uncharacterized protein LOC117650525 [Thrips palmi]
MMIPWVLPLFLAAACSAVPPGYLDGYVQGYDSLGHDGYEVLGHGHSVIDAAPAIKYAVPDAHAYVKEPAVTYVQKVPVSYASPEPLLGYAKSPVVYAPESYHDASPVVYAKSSPVVYAPQAHAPVAYAEKAVAVAPVAVAAPSYALGHDLTHDLGHTTVISDDHGHGLEHATILADGHGLEHSAVLADGHGLGHAVVATPDLYSYGSYGTGLKGPLSYASYGHVGHSLYDGSVAYGSSYGYPTAKGPGAKAHGYTSVVKGPHSISYQSVHKEDVPYGYASHYGYAGHGLLGGEVLSGGLGHGLVSGYATSNHGYGLGHGHGLVSSYATYNQGHDLGLGYGHGYGHY